MICSQKADFEQNKSQNFEILGIKPLKINWKLYEIHFWVRFKVKGTENESGRSFLSVIGLKQDRLFSLV